MTRRYTQTHREKERKFCGLRGQMNENYIESHGEEKQFEND
jgi:hypothetical protein